VVTRAVADGLSTHLGQAVVVENRGGASGTIALQGVIRAPDDGYTFLMSYPSIVINTPVTFKGFPYNLEQELQGVAGVSFVELVMNVNASVPVTNPREFIDWVKKQAVSGQLSYGSYGEGSYAHIAAHYMSSLYGLNAVHIPYKGEQPMLLAIASNDIPYGIGSFAPSKTMQDTGKTRMIGVLKPERTPFLPDLPTFKEMGIDDPAFQFNGAWYGLFARKSVPESVIKKMEAAVLAVLKTAQMQQRLNTIMVPAWGVGAKEFEATWHAETSIYRNLLRMAGVQMYE